LRTISVVAGLALLILAIAAAGQVADSRQGQVAEVISLLAGLAGIGLLGFAFGYRRGGTGTARAASARSGLAARPRSNRDLALGAGGVLLAILLLTGLAISGGILWAGFGLALLLPMIAGSVYLCVRFLRANP